MLVRQGASFQRTKSWQESPDAAFDAKLDRIEDSVNERPDRTFAFDEFGPLGIHPTWRNQNARPLTPSQHNDANARVCAARKASAGAGGPLHQYLTTQPDEPTRS